MRRARHPRRTSPSLRRPPAARRLAVAVAGLAVLGTACSGDDGPGAGLPSATTSVGEGMARLQLAASLQPFAACDELLDHLHTEAGARVTAYGLPGMGGPVYWAEGDMARSAPATTAAGAGAPLNGTGTDDAASASAAPVAAEQGTAGGSYSGTNTVEAGIDEGDTVKTDGTHLYLLSNGRLRIVTADPANPQLVGSLELPGGANQLVRVGSTLLITGWPEQASPATDSAGSSEREIMPWSWSQQTALWQVDVSDPAAPTLERQLVVDGSVLSIRMTGDVARVVVQTPPPGLDFVTATSPFAEERALATNREVIAESTIDDWLPSYRLLGADGRAINDGHLAACEDVARPEEFHGFSTTTVLSVDVADGLSEPVGSAVIADGQRVYASAEHLYVAIGAWQDPGGPVTIDGDVATTTAAPPQDDTARTDVHRFTFDGDRAAYTATGTVEGSLMNDFSMSERDGILRVATTAGTPWGWGWGTSDQSESYVTTLRAEGGELVQVGRVGDLGRGESIYAVRFIGTNGYVVTFRQTDPLYVIDLRDPANPTVTGELKINGYSAYLHELSDGRLLGVGQDATDEGRVTGGQVSIFDVSNPATPTRTATYALPNGNFNAEYDYKAFLYWAPEELVLLPASSWDPTGQTFTGVIGLSIGETIAERGRLAATPSASNGGCPVPMPIEDGPATVPATEPATAPDAPATTVPAPPDATSSSSSSSFAPCMPWAAPFERSVVVGSSVFAISSEAVQAADLASLAPQGRVGLD